MALTTGRGEALARAAFGMLGGFGPVNRPMDLPPPLAEPSMLTLTIELRNSEPRIWRRLVLPGDLTLDGVHTLFQAAMGWTDSHVHRFQPGTGQGPDEPYFLNQFDQQEGEPGTPEQDVRLDQVMRATGDRLTYLYDFGDDWEHVVTLEQVTLHERSEPRCIGGAKACPPEDIGGIWGHQEVAAWLRSGTPADSVPVPFEGLEQALRWLPSGYDPDAFDPDEATEAMRLWAAGQHLPWYGLPEPLVALLQMLQGPGWDRASTWLAGLGSRVPVALDEEDVLRAARPWVVVLHATWPQVKLTAAGYLPPAVVREIAMDLGIQRVWRGQVNREDMTWPVAALREAAQGLGLLRKAKGTLSPTARANRMADDVPAIVTSVLQRMPVGKGYEGDAGWFAVLGLAAGVSGPELDAGVAQMLEDRGWRADGSQITARVAADGFRLTGMALEYMSGGFRTADPELTTRLARAVLFGVAPG